jgi:AcrR family transcriptional regulator
MGLRQPTEIPEDPALRRDAEANRARILAAAAAAVRRRSATVPMSSIADDAGVGVGTLYRHFPTRAKLLSGLEERSYRLILEHARRAAGRTEPAIASLAYFLERIIEDRDQLFLPLHGGHVSLDERTVAVRTEISDTLEQVFARGRDDGSVRPDATAVDIIITGAFLTTPLPNAPDWDHLARRQACIFLAGLAAPGDAPLPGSRPTRRHLEEGFSASRGRPPDR